MILPRRPRLWLAPLACAFAAAPSLAFAGELQPTTAPALDPDAAAHLILRDSVVDEGARTFAWGGRFVGDLNGDGSDDVALPSGAGDQLELLFGRPGMALSEPDELGDDGDTTLHLPDGCRRGDLWISLSPLGDIDGDGNDDLGVACPQAQEVDGSLSYQGVVAIYLGRSGAWSGSVSSPDVLLLGEPIETEGSDITAGSLFAEDLAGVGDIDGDGLDDFVVTGRDASDSETPTSLVFLGDSDPETALVTSADATWFVRGGEFLRCLTGPSVNALGDIDGGGLSDFALLCEDQPTSAGDVPNSSDIGFQVFYGESLSAGAAGERFYSDRDLAHDAGTEHVAVRHASSAFGDLDGEAGGEFGIVSWSSAAGTASAQVLLGGSNLEGGLSGLGPHLPFYLGTDVDHREGLQLAAAGDLMGQGQGLWLRYGTGSAAQIGLLHNFDIGAWDEAAVPPVQVVFTPPGGATINEEWRLGLGGVGDFNGDGTADLLVLSGYEDSGSGCTPELCGGAWLILCADGDGDGRSACGGDCDDRDPGRGPTVSEQCDAIDHDCDGASGQADLDGDGVLGCAGDCDDSDAERFPGADESCEDETDTDCDGLAPQEDSDNDGAINCEDCQPWMDESYPGATEICDGLDNDCNDVLDPEEQDIDQDGTRACDDGSGITDCDDRNPFVHPLRFEDCTNGVDDDCNGQIDEDEDADSDQVTRCQGDCRDDDPTVFPGAAELCDGLDNNCNQVVDEGRDLDGDGFSSCQGDCDEDDPSVFPGATSHCDGTIDGNCDGVSDLVDADQDGFSPCGGDCNDTEPGIHPASLEWCDRLDNDCDGTVDLPFDTDGDGWAVCLGDCVDQDSQRHPQIQEPDCSDGADGDCDGTLDSQDSDCPTPEPVVELPPRPHGLSCAGCGSTLEGSPNRYLDPRGLLALAVLLVFPIRRRRRVGRRSRPGGLRRVRRLPSARGASAVLPSLLAAASLALVSGLFLPSSAHARKEPAVVVYLASQPDIRYMAEATAALRHLDPRDVLHTSELWEPVSGGITVQGARRVDRCPSGGSPPSLGDLTQKALDRIIDLDYRGAYKLLNRGIAELPCIESPALGRFLPRLYFYRGVAADALGRDTEAQEDFARAHSIAPDYTGDPNFPPHLSRGLEDARSQAAGAEAASLRAFVEAGGRLRVDGREIEPPSGPIQLAPGQHFVQLQRTGGLDSALVELNPGSQAIVVAVGDRDRALRAASYDPVARDFVATQFALAAVDDGVDLVVLADFDTGGDPVRYGYRVGADEFSFEAEGGQPAAPPEATDSIAAVVGEGGTLRVTSSSRTRKSAPSRRARSRPRAASSGPIVPAEMPRLRLRVSAGYSYVHDFSYVRIPIDIGIHLLSGLHVDVAIAAATSGPVAPYGPIWLPTAAAGVSYRHAMGIFHVRIGVLGRLSLENSVGEVRPLGGWSVIAGGEVLPPDSAFFFGFDAQGGMLGPPFYLAISAGAGVRF